MDNFNYVNPIDTLDTLLKVEDENKYTEISYFKLWIRTVLEQRDGDFATLDKISTRLSAKFKKSEGNGNRNNTIDEYVLAAVLRYVCRRESLEWNKAFKALEDTYGYLEYSNIDPAYVLYLVGRLFYDIQEYYEDYVHIRTEFTNNINRNASLLTLDGKFDFIKKERVENCIRALLPGIVYKVPDIFVTANDMLIIAELFFENAYKKKNKEHYMAWLALTCQKKGQCIFERAITMLIEKSKKTDDNSRMKSNMIQKVFLESQQEYENAIKKYEHTIELANKNIPNLLLNLGVCYFYQEMITIILNENDYIKIFESCQNAFGYLTKAINTKDESHVKSEYTFRRNPLDVYYYRLVAMFEFVKLYSKKNIKDYNIDKLCSLFKEFSDLLTLEQNEINHRVEYFITMAIILDYLQAKGLVVNGDYSAETYWETAKEYDKVKFDFPFRIGLAFKDKKYAEKWSEELRTIKYKLNVDTSFNDGYEYYQNLEIKKHFQEINSTTR